MPTHNPRDTPDRGLARYLVVSHSHLDREWYRTAEAFRNRLVDSLDAVLDLLASDPEFVFVLDGQTVVVEDYLELRSERETELRGAIAAGRLSIGPWYVQADGLMPAAESIIRNLLEGARMARRFGSTSSVGYLPDTFGHPAQLPTILKGFGIEGFCFRRGANDETDALSSEFLWEARDGSTVLALHLSQGYSTAGYLPRDPAAAAERLERIGLELAQTTRGDTVTVMHGCDHAVPRSLSAILTELRRLTAAHVSQGTIDDALAAHSQRAETLGTYRGELRGALGEAVLPGVLSTRTYLKMANAHCEALMIGIAEPFAALSRAFGGPDDTAALAVARRGLLANQAHDSLGGTCIDAAHREMEARVASATELAQAVAERAFGTLGGTGPARPGAWEGGADLAVFNPHPYRFTGVVQHWFDADPPYAVSETPPRLTNPPLLRAVLDAGGLAVDGAPARLLERTNTRLFVWHAEQKDRGVEFVATDVPPFGWKRFRLTTEPAADDHVDRGRHIEVDGLGVDLNDDGTVTLRHGERSWSGLLGLEDMGDEGDTYDFAGVGGAVRAAPLEAVRRRRHASGIARLGWTRRLRLPAARRGEEATAADPVDLVVDTEVRLAPGVPRADVTLRLRNTARDHRLRLTFRLAQEAQASLSVGPFDIIQRAVEPPPSDHWVQPAPRTFPAHGAVTVPGSHLAVCAPGLYETEVTPAGELAVTMLRAVGMIGADLPRRGIVAPAIQVPEAQCQRELEIRVSLVPMADNHDLARLAREVSLPLGCAEAGQFPLAPDGHSLLSIGPSPLVVSAVKTSDVGTGTVVRVWNPGEEAVDGWIEPGWPVTAAASVGLDETPDDQSVVWSDGRYRFHVPAFSVRTVRLDDR